MHRTVSVFLSLLFLAYSGLFLSSCSSSKPVAKEDEKVSKKEKKPVSETTESNISTILDETRSSLTDVYQNQHHDIPAIFSKIDTARSASQNPFDGYRVQILSSKNVARADSLASDFNAWADSTLSGYIPKAYIFFKQPYYKVNVGDFHQYERATNFSRLIKRKYSEAWVVHDHIDPELVPADTTMMGFKKDSEKR